MEDQPWISDDLKKNLSSLSASTPIVVKNNNNQIFKNSNKLSLKGKNNATAQELVKTPNSGSQSADLIPIPHMYSLIWLVDWGPGGITSPILCSVILHLLIGLILIYFYNIPHVCILSSTTWLFPTHQSSSLTEALMFLWSCILVST